MKDTGVITSTQILSSAVKSYNIDIDITPMEPKYNSAQQPILLTTHWYLQLSQDFKKIDIGALSIYQYLRKVKQKQTNN